MLAIVLASVAEGDAEPSAAAAAAMAFGDSSGPAAACFAASSAGGSPTGGSGVAAVVFGERSAARPDNGFALAANSASASLLSTAAAIAETPVIPTDSMSPPGAAANVAANVLNISASSE